MISSLDSAPCRRHPRHGGLLSGFLIGLGVSTVVTMLVGVLVGYMLETKPEPRTPEQQVADQIDVLLAAVANGTYGDAYRKMCSPQLREGTSAKGWGEACEEWKKDFGALKSKRQTQYQRLPRKDLYLVRVAYDADFEKGSAQIMADLQKIETRWVFEGILIRKPADEKKK